MRIALYRILPAQPIPNQPAPSLNDYLEIESRSINWLPYDYLVHTFGSLGGAYNYVRDQYGKGAYLFKVMDESGILLSADSFRIEQEPETCQCPMTLLMTQGCGCGRP